MAKFKLNQIVVTTTRKSDACTGRDLPKNSPVKITKIDHWDKCEVQDKHRNHWLISENNLDIASPKEKAEYRNVFK